MVYKKNYFFLILLLIISSCKPPEPDTSSFTNTSSSCVYTGTLEFDLGVDITTDFNESNITQKAKVVTSQCTNVYTGTESTANTANIKREGNTLTISNNGKTISLTISSNSITDIPSESGSVSGGSLTVTYSNGTMVSGSKTIIYNYSATYTKYLGYKESSNISEKNLFLMPIDFL